MTVKILTDAQKKAVGLLYSHKRKNIKQLALALDVSERTIQRVVDEQLNLPHTLVDTNAEARKVLALLYKHKVSYEQLESLLSLPTGQTSPASSELTMPAVQQFLCMRTKEELATLFYVSGLAKLMDVVVHHQATRPNQEQPINPTAPIPKSAQQPLDLGAKHVRTA